MTRERHYQVLVAPHVSEKAELAADHGQYVFKVAIDASKTEIKAAVESIFAVNVVGIQVIKVKGKTKRRGMISGRRSDWKKALVRLSDGQSVDYESFGGNA